MKLNMFFMYMFVASSVLISMILFMLSNLITKKTKLDREKSSPFECGFDLMLTTRNPFSLRFFLIAVIFIIFDVEITLLLPMMVSFFMSSKKMWLISSFMVMVILCWGLYHEWMMNSLNWKIF